MLKIEITDDLKRRFWEKVDKGEPSECWLWTAYRHPNGYGQFRAWGRIRQAHRVVWTLKHGDIPEGMYVLHKCDNRDCCNPTHLILASTQQNKSIEERFWEKVDKDEPGECWEWLAGKDDEGYGSFWSWGQNSHAHRVAWRLTQGEIPGGLCCLHRCDNRACCNPAHLFLGTRADNAHDRSQKGRSAKGSAQGQSKLTEKQVLEIRHCYATEDILPIELAEDYPVSRRQIYYIINRKRWSHI